MRIIFSVNYNIPASGELPGGCNDENIVHVDLTLWQPEMVDYEECWKISRLHLKLISHKNEVITQTTTMLTFRSFFSNGLGVNPPALDSNAVPLFSNSETAAATPWERVRNF